MRSYLAVPLVALILAVASPALAVPAYCTINGSTFSTGDRNPANPCETCDPPNDNMGWTAADGAPCPASVECMDGTCNGNQCDTTALMPSKDGTKCPGSNDCNLGKCNAGQCQDLPLPEHTACGSSSDGSTMCGDADGNNTDTVFAYECDGTGSCNAVPKDVCSPFACDAMTGDCEVGCATNAECPTGYTCDGSTCQPEPGTGDGMDAGMGFDVGDQIPDASNGSDDAGATDDAAGADAGGGDDGAVDSGADEVNPMPKDDVGGCACTTGGPLTGDAWLIAFVALGLAVLRRR